MKITVVTADQMIIVDGDPVQVQQHGQPFQVPNGEWSVHFDEGQGVGEVEYIDSRLNETINQAAFDDRYRFLLNHYRLAKAERDRQQSSDGA